MENFLKGREKEISFTSLTAKRAKGFNAVGKCSNPMQADFSVHVDVPVETEEPEGPKVELISEDGRVVSIVVSCSCGKRLELACEY